MPNINSFFISIHDSKIHYVLMMYRHNIHTIQIAICYSEVERTEFSGRNNSTVVWQIGKFDLQLMIDRRPKHVVVGKYHPTWLNNMFKLFYKLLSKPGVLVMI